PSLPPPVPGGPTGPTGRAALLPGMVAPPGPTGPRAPHTPPAPSPAGLTFPAPTRAGAPTGGAPLDATAPGGAPTGQPAGATGGPTRDIRLKGAGLTVRVTAVSLDEVLATISEQSNAEIRGSVLAPHDVTTDFENVLVQDGLHRILGDQNFILTYREDGTLRT